MPLTLEVVGQKASRMGPQVRKTFHAGGTIGREPDNDWAFPDEYISGHHAKITFAAGIFSITDTSTNGVFINSPQTRLTRGQPYTLHEGDTLYIDDYEVRVTLDAEPEPGDSIASSVPLDDGFAQSSGVNETDPLLLLNIKPRSAGRGPTAESLANKSALSQNFQPPPPRSPPPQITPPESVVYAKKLIPVGYNPFAPKITPSADKASPRPGDPASFTQVLNGPAAEPPRIATSADSRGHVSPEHVSPQHASADLPFVDSRARVAPLVNPAAVAAAEARARLAESARAVRSTSPFERPPPPQTPASNSVVAQPPGSPAQPVTGGADLDFATLLAAAGIDSVQATPELAQQFGQILRIVVAGLMDVLRARDTIKNEFRMRMTTFKQIDNNPLKYSANVEDALFNLLVKRNSAYLGPVDAFEDAFRDVRNHQMSMLAGMRVAYDSLLAAFDPAHLQQEFDRQVKSGSFLNSSKAKYWEAYSNKFHDMAKDADSTFRKLFGDEFAKAYEEQLARLRAEKRSDR